MKEFFNKEPVKRAIRTFLQAALGVLTANLIAGNFSTESDALKTTLISLSTSAIAAGVAAVMNLNKNTESEDENNG